jgi:hypothetical protein
MKSRIAYHIPVTQGMTGRSLGYRVDLWTADQASILEAVATANHLNVGRAAYTNSRGA